jgi:hypothetical protein
MYEHMSPYFREHLARSNNNIYSVLGPAPEDNPNILPEYIQILRTPGFGYEFFAEEETGFASPVWQWRVNRELQLQIRLMPDDDDEYDSAVV